MMLRRRACRRPRPIEPPPFVDEGTCQNYAGGSSPSRLPRRPRPPGDPPLAPVLSTGTACPKGNDTAHIASMDAVAITSLVKGGRPTGADANNAGSSMLKAIPRDSDSPVLAKEPRHHKDKTVFSSGVSGAKGDPVIDDPLRHSGLWVPVGYSALKRIPWTGYWTCCGNKTAFTTHCTGFDARMLQRQAEHRREVAEQLVRARKPIADKFRVEWEEATDRPSTSSNPNLNEVRGIACGSRDSDAEGSAPTEGKGTGSEKEVIRQRPFLRRQRLDRLRQFSGNRTTSAAAEAEPKAEAAEAAEAATTNLPSSTAAPASAAASPSAIAVGRPFAEPSKKTKSAALVRVGRTHVKSVVHLALSEAKANAFVVMDCLEGLLSVAMDGREGTVAQASGSNSIRQNGDDRVGSTGGRRTSSEISTRDVGTKSEGEGGPSLQQDSASVNRGQQFEGLRGGADTYNKGGSHSRTEESGASFCVRLGALPAVLGCLNEHAHHKEIEPLAVKLLCVFASDGATSVFVRGSIAVTAACAARMSPSVVLPAPRDAGRSGDGQMSNAKRESTLRDIPGRPLSDEPGRNESEESTGNAQIMGHLVPVLGTMEKSVGDGVATGVEFDEDGGRTARKYVGNGRGATVIAAASASSPDSLTSSGAASDERTSGTAMTSATSPTAISTAPNQRRDRVGQSPSPDGVTASPARPMTGSRSTPPLSQREHADSSSLTPPQPNQTPRPRLPATNLMFVLSVAVQDSPQCQRFVLKKGGIAAMSAALEHLVARAGGKTGNGRDEQGDDSRLAKACLTVLEQLGQQERGRTRLVREGAVEIAIASIGRFRSDDGLLATATSLLLLLSDSEEARDRILKAGGFLVVFEAMKRLVGNDLVQVKGAEMLQTLIKEEPQARRELDSIKGAWQWLCQGTSGGHALIRYAPGEKHIPGWTACEAERLTAEEALVTAEMAASNWTPYKLAAFMGTMRNQHKLQIGNLAYHHFFRVVTEAGLLPHVHEGVEEWRGRLRRYEDERHIKIGNITRRRLARDKGGAHAMSLGTSSQASIR